jgi:hypothetical protein
LQFQIVIGNIRCGGGLGGSVFHIDPFPKSSSFVDYIAEKETLVNAFLILMNFGSICSGSRRKSQHPFAGIAINPPWARLQFFAGECALPPGTGHWTVAVSPVSKSDLMGM